MTEDPYRAPGAEIHTDADATGLPLVLLAASSLLLLAIAGWCFFLSDALATLSVQGSARIESIERVSRQIRDSNSIPNPEVNFSP